MPESLHVLGRDPDVFFTISLGLNPWLIFFKKDRFLLNNPGEFGIITIAIEMADIAENRTSRAAAQVKKALFCIINANVLNILVYK